MPKDIKQDFISKLRGIEKALIDLKIRGEWHLDLLTKEAIGEAIVQINKTPQESHKSVCEYIKIMLQINGGISLVERTYHLPQYIEKFVSILSQATQNILPPG